MPMTDDELAKYLRIENEPKCAAIIAKIPPAQRASYDAMADMEMQLSLWQAGLAPRPKNVLIDMDRKRR